MASMRDIKRRKQSIRSTGQITKAMKLVSTVKLQKARGRAEEAKPYFNHLYQTIVTMFDRATPEVRAHYSKENGTAKKAMIVIIYAATKKHLLDVAVSDIAEYEKVLFELIENQYPEIFRTIREQKVLTEEIEPKLVLAIEQAKEGFSTK